MWLWNGWGKYAKAVALHGARMKRRAPFPFEVGPNDNRRVTVAFVEWMMMLPEGHVADIPIARIHQLRALGNGVVPNQAALALSHLHPDPPSI